MSTTTAPPRTQGRPAPRLREHASMPRESVSRHREEWSERPSVRRVLLVELPAADEIWARLASATQTLRNPADVRVSIATIGAQVIAGLRRLERPAERAMTELQREITRAVKRIDDEVRHRRENPPPLLNPVPFPL